MELIAQAVNDYIEKQYPKPEPVLEEMERLGRKRDFPIVGPQVGRVLSLLARLADAKRIFEMGSGFGYSAYWFARDLPAGGKIYQTEGSEANSKLARDFFKRAGLEKKSEFLVGDGVKLIDETTGPFDLIFIDIDKENYPSAFKKAKPRLRKGGLLIADNLLWFGKVLENNPDPETSGIKEYTRLLFQDKDFFATILPIRDGVGVGFRL